MLKLAKKNETTTPRRIVLHLTRTHLGMLIIDESTALDGPDAAVARNGRWQRLPWPGPTLGLPTGDEAQKLTTLLKEIVDREKLAGVAVALTLGGDFCVTRVVTGQTQRVDQELQKLAQRSERYLSLGAGPKAQVAAHHMLDTRRKLSWMTIVNQRTLETLLQCVQDAGLKLERIEHSLIGLSRAVGMARIDARSPVILIEVGERGVDLGVTYQGRLLLDYRPGGLTAQNHILETLELHLDRIQRYCNRQMQFQEGKITKVLLCGEPAAITAALEQFSGQTKLTAEAFCPREVPGLWNWPEQQWPSTSLSPAIGTLLADSLSDPTDRGPDLMDHVRAQSREPIFPLLAKTCWPIAATLLICLGLMTYNGYRSFQLDQLAQEAQAGNSQDIELRGVKMKLTATETELNSLRQLDSSISHTAWHELLMNIGGCLPDGVWMEGVKVERDRTLLLSGPSFTEDGVYEFVEHLKKVPELQNVVLEGTRPARLKSGPATLFDIRGKVKQANFKEGANHGK